MSFRIDVVNIAWGVVVVVLSLVCWGGQLMAAVAPTQAAELGLADAESEVDRVFWLDGRGEALWDTLILWPMPVAGVMMILDHDWWPYFGLVGGGAYLYFAGRGIAVRLVMRRHGVLIGSARTVRTALVALLLWGAMAVITIVSSVVTLEGS